MAQIKWINQLWTGQQMVFLAEKNRNFIELKKKKCAKCFIFKIDILENKADQRKKHGFIKWMLIEK